MGLPVLNRRRARLDSLRLTQPMNLVFAERPSWPQRFGSGMMLDVIGLFVRVGAAAARMAALRFSGARRDLDQGILFLAALGVVGERRNPFCSHKRQTIQRASRTMRPDILELP